MASSTSSPLRLSLSKYARIPEVLTLLESCGILKTLSLSYGEAVARLRKSDPSRLREDKDVLKLISCQLIDEVYNTLESQAEVPATVQDLPTTSKSDFPSKLTKQQLLKQRRKSESARSHPLSKSQTNLQSQALEDKLISEFNQIVGPATFTKQKRRIGEISPVLPGPGAYNTDPDLLRTHSPRAVIPVGGQRVSFQGNTGPGPADYVYHGFIAKRR